MKRNDMDREIADDRRKRRSANAFILFVFIIIFVPLTLVLALEWFAQSDFFTMGITGYIQNVIINVVLGICAAIIAIVSMGKLFQREVSIGQKIIRIVVIALCIAVDVYFIRPFILDIPYLNQPKITYLSRLDFDSEMGIGDSPDNYYLKGVDITGERFSFEISREKLEEGKELSRENDHHLYAKITYLPYTSTIMTLEWMKNIDDDTMQLYPPSENLSDDWESYSIQINDTVYALPLPLTAFLDEGWYITEENADLQLQGLDGPSAQYEREWISLVNDMEQTISVMVYNTTEKTLPVSECIVGDISVIYGNYDFSGTQLRIPGGLMLGWSTREDVLDLYGQPYDSFETYSLTYQSDDLFSAYWHFYFNDSGYLDSIIVHRQATYPLD